MGRPCHSSSYTETLPNVGTDTNLMKKLMSQGKVNLNKIHTDQKRRVTVYYEQQLKSGTVRTSRASESHTEALA